MTRRLRGLHSINPPGIFALRDLQPLLCWARRADAATEGRRIRTAARAALQNHQLHHPRGRTRVHPAQARSRVLRFPQRLDPQRPGRGPQSSGSLPGAVARGGREAEGTRIGDCRVQGFRPTRNGSRGIAPETGRGKRKPPAILESARNQTAVAVRAAKLELKRYAAQKSVAPGGRDDSHSTG